MENSFSAQNKEKAVGQLNERKRMSGELSQQCRFINAETIIRSQQYFKQRKMSQSQSPQQLPLSTQNKQFTIPIESLAETFKLELSVYQATYLTKLLPTNYSFQVQPKSIKHGETATKNQKEQTKALLQLKKKPTKENIKNLNTAKYLSRRVQKSNSSHFTQENENAIYEKYSVQKYSRRNSFENVSQALKPCLRILKLLKNSKTSWPFIEPVDPIALGIPHYTQIIKQPMDLSTIENNLKTNQYTTPTQFHADVAKIITNSYTFNAYNPQFTKITRQFETYYQKIRSQSTSDLGISYSSQPENIPSDFYSGKVASLENKKAKKETKELAYSQPASHKITMNEKKELGLNIKKLAKEYMKGILQIVNEGRQKSILEFDLKELDDDIIRKLQLYVKEKLSGQSQGTMRGKPKQHQEESSFQVGEQSQS